MASLTRAVSGLLLRDDFARADGALGANYTSEVNGARLGIVGNEVVSNQSIEARVRRSDVAGLQEVVAQCRFAAVAGGYGGLTFRHLHGGSEEFFLVQLQGNNSLVGFCYTSGSYWGMGSASTTYVTGAYQKLKGHSKDSYQKFWHVDTGAVVTNNNPSLNGKAGLAGFRLGEGLGNKWDDLSIYKSNSVVVTNLPAGFKARVGTVTAVSSGGVATVDLGAQWCPIASVDVLDGSNVLQATLSPTDGVWGGDSYAYAGNDPPTAPGAWTNPNAVGQALHGVQTVVCGVATDPNSDPLTYTIQLSSDGGVTFPTTLGSGLASPSISLNLLAMSGGAGIHYVLRCAATDSHGAQGSWVVSPYFWISDTAPPTPTVAVPVPGTTYGVSSTDIAVAASSVDAESDTVFFHFMWSDDDGATWAEFSDAVTGADGSGAPGVAAPWGWAHWTRNASFAWDVSSLLFGDLYRLRVQAMDSQWGSGESGWATTGAFSIRHADVAPDAGTLDAAATDHNVWLICDNGGEVLGGARYQLDVPTGNFSAPLQDSLATTSPDGWWFTDLTPDTSYIARYQKIGYFGGDGAWSEPVAFHTSRFWAGGYLNLSGAPGNGGHCAKDATGHGYVGDYESFDPNAMNFLFVYPWDGPELKCPSLIPATADDPGEPSYAIGLNIGKRGGYGAAREILRLPSGTGAICLFMVAKRTERTVDTSYIGGMIGSFQWKADGNVDVQIYDPTTHITQWGTLHGPVLADAPKLIGVALDLGAHGLRRWDDSHTSTVDQVLYPDALTIGGDSGLEVGHANVSPGYYNSMFAQEIFCFARVPTDEELQPVFDIFHGAVTGSIKEAILALNPVGYWRGNDTLPPAVPTLTAE